MSQGSEATMSSLGALQFAAVGLESINYGQLQQHLQRQVVCLCVCLSLCLSCLSVCLSCLSVSVCLSVCTLVLSVW